MAERGASTTSLSDKDSEHLSDEKGADVVKEIERDFDECAHIGKSVIESIKASLFASSSSFNKAKYATPIENPYSKAYYYLEENRVLAMLEDLITYTVFHQPEKPFPFMRKVVENYYDDLNKKDSREG